MYENEQGFEGRASAGVDSVQPEGVTHEGLSVTPISALKSYSGGQVVELPPFAEGQPFVARIRRPSMLVMMKTGKIPNQLLTTAQGLFMKGSNSIDFDDEHATDAMLDVMLEIAKAAFVEPSYSELESAGIELTDEQLMFLLNYCQNGVSSLKSFHN